MEISVADEIQLQPDNHTENKASNRAGKVLRKWLLTAEGKDGLRFRLFQSNYQKGEDAFESPRHHHPFQQIRWTDTGSINYAPDQDIPAGSLAYFPKGTFYGPQRKDQGSGLLVQFGFDAELIPARFDSTAPRKAVPLKADGDVLVAKRPMVEAAIAAERYDAPILIHPTAFEYYETSPGVEIKNLGGFYDHDGPNADVRIMMVRLEKDGRYELFDDRAQLGWSVSDGLNIDGRTYPRLTSFYSPLGEAAAISGPDGAEVYVVEFPRLD